MTRPSRERRCRCGSHRRFNRCCGPYLDGAPAPSPEALMRSRYSAYALRRADYIRDTTDPDGPEWRTDTQTWTADIERFCMSTRFQSLEILDAPPPQDDEGTVTFHANLSQSGHDLSFTETSRFVRDPTGRWRYHSGQRVSG